MTHNTLEQTIEQALQYHQAGDLEQATTLFEQILVDNPNQPDALHGLGLIYAQEKNFNQAIHYLSQAVRANPSIAPFHNNLANAYKAAGKIDEALKHYHEALRLKSNYPQAHNNLGALLYRIGKYDEAANHFFKSLRMDPKSVDTHYNLANCLVQLDKLSEAQSHFEAVLALRPEHLGALQNLGLTYIALKNFAKAQPLLTQVLEREPNNRDALFHLGIIETAQLHADQAIAYYLRAIALNDADSESHHNIATLYLQNRDQTLALHHFKKAYAVDEHNQTAKHMIDALTGHTSTEGAPAQYVQALFDQYAYSYDEQVKQQLRYQVPFLLREALTPFIPEKNKPWHGLDLGCGTGLCAPYFNDLCDTLVGVDLSRNMLEVAKQSGAYLSLHHDDIIHFLQINRKEFELIFAADVLVYCGDLSHFFQGLVKASAAQALICFNIELLEAEGNAPNFQLQTTGRYAHQAQYIHEAIGQQFKILHESKHILRYQEEQPVSGLIYVLRTEK